MAGVKIYGVPPTRTFRPIWVAHELGIEHEIVSIDRSTGQNRTPEFLKLNPNGAIPVLVDGDFVLWESMAIDFYLAKKYDNGKGLAPRDLKEEALALQWTLFAVNTLEQPVIDWALNAFVLPQDKRDAKVADAAAAKMQAPLKVLDGALQGKQWLVGNRFTVADLNVAAAAYRLLQMDLAKFPAVDAWLDRCFTRPAALSARKLRE
jgi:glutathione S-transferase